MDRDDFVRDIYQLFNRYSKESSTGYGRFAFLCKYVAFWDKKGKQIEFNEEEVLKFFAYREKCVTRGEVNKNSLSKERQHLSSILKELGKTNIALQLPKIFGRRNETKPTESIPDKSYTDIGSTLIKAYKKYVEFIFAGKPPSKCPIFDIELAKKNGLTDKAIKKSRGLKYVEQNDFWTNSATKLALLITAMWTGGNLTPLAQLTKKDAKLIKKVSGDRYEFDSVKARALYEKQQLGLGFTKRSKEFIESWMLVSEKIAPGDDAPLFPLFDINGNLRTALKAYANPHKTINPKLVAMGLPKVTIRRLRSTRSSLVMRAYDDIFTVAAANRNTLETTKDHYLEGVGDVHNMALAQAFEVQKALAEGKDKKSAIDEFKAVIKDPYTTEEWEKKKQSAIATKIPTGVRCTDPNGDIAKKSLRAIKVLNLGDDRECISFLACFDCSKHALVADVDDIWLMLSFKDSIESSLARPSVNSFPQESFHNTLSKAIHILSRMAEISPENYKVAKSKNKAAPHPLYQEENDLTDLLGVYAL